MKIDTIAMLARKGCAVLSIIALISLVVLMLASWIITSANPDLPMRSLLSSEGIRWLFGLSASHLANPVGVWLLLLSFTFGAVRESGVKELFRRDKQLTYRQRFALRLTLVEALLIVGGLLLLTVAPHAVMLGVTGTLLTGSFIHGAIPLLLLSITVMSLTYGMVSGTIVSLSKAFDAMATGVRAFAPAFVLYVFATELIASACFVFSVG